MTIEMLFAGETTKRQGVFRMDAAGKVELFLLETAPVSPLQWRVLDCRFIAGSADEVKLLEDWRGQ